MNGSLAAQYGEEILSMREEVKKTVAEERKETQKEKEKKEPSKPALDHPWRSFKIHPAVCGKSSISIA
jgi:hypothetical protein